MTNYTEIKRLAEACGSEYSADEPYQQDRHYSEQEVASLEFQAVATPATVLALIAENEALRKDAERYRLIRTTGFRQVDTSYWSGEGETCDKSVDDPEWFFYG